MDLLCFLAQTVSYFQSHLEHTVVIFNRNTPHIFAMTSNTLGINKILLIISTQY